MTDEPANSESMPDRADAIELVMSYMSSFDDRDPDTIAAHVSEDFSNRHTAALASGCEGRAAYRERLPGFLASMPGLHYEIEQLVADGPNVAVFYTMTGRWQGETDFEVRGVKHLRLADGKITQRTDYWDSAVFLAQVDVDAAETLATLGLA